MKKDDLLLAYLGLNNLELHKFAMRFCLVLLGIALGANLTIPQSMGAAGIILLGLKWAIPFIIKGLSKVAEVI